MNHHQISEKRKTNMKKLTIILGMVLFLASLGSAQSILVNTTLAAAVADSKVQLISVASATGINAPSLTDYTKRTQLYVDRELMDVKAVSGTTITVIRGAGGTVAAPHASSAFVFVIPVYLSQNFR